MSTLHVRNVPPPVYRALQKRARERQSSVSAETIRLLERALRIDRTGVRELLESIERTRPRARGRAPSAAALIRQERNRR
jgi:plasmid stability protein